MIVFRIFWDRDISLVFDKLASLRDGKPCWRVENTSPGPRVFRSNLAIFKPFLCLVIKLSLSKALELSESVKR